VIRSYPDIPGAQFMYIEGSLPPEKRVNLVFHADCKTTTPLDVASDPKRTLHLTKPKYQGEFCYGWDFGPYEGAKGPRLIVPDHDKQTIESIFTSEGEIIRGTNPNVCLGADDRAGMAMVWLLADLGHNIIITDGEEMGLLGADFLMEDPSNKDIRDEINKALFGINFDKPGNGVVDYYSIPCTEHFKQFCENAYKGFTRAPVSAVRSDAVALSGPGQPSYVTPSVGYRKHHTPNEEIVFDHWVKTLYKTQELLKRRDLPKFENLEPEVGL